jgi:glycosyltransferase involved in cell wall biosynthesis
MRAWLDRLPWRRTPPQNLFELSFVGHKDAPNVLILTEHINATYFISFDLPLRKLHAAGKVNVAVASQGHVAAIGAASWKSGKGEFLPDIVIMTRYGHPNGLQMLEFFRHSGVPVIYHIDDDLLEVPEVLGNEIGRRQGGAEIIATRRALLAGCDLIYASTAELAGKLQERFPHQAIYHGMYAPYMGDDIDLPESSGHSPIIGYMGSKGHQHDLDLVVPALERLLEERQELEFAVFGTISLPSTLKRFGKRVKSYAVQKRYTEFLRTLAHLNWDIGLAPLVDIPFNRCKAPTKFIEYTACGIPVIASRVSVYEKAMPSGGGQLVEQDWYSALTHYLDHPDLSRKALATARAHCANTYSIERLQRQLLDVFDSQQLKRRR